MFMIENKLMSDNDNLECMIPDSAGLYKVAEKQDVTKFSKLFYQTGRLQGTDSYLWISPFVRYTHQINHVNDTVQGSCLPSKNTVEYNSH